MSKQRAVLGILLIVALLAPGMTEAEPAAPQAAPAPQAQAGPILFVENAGQWPDAARFQVWGSPAGIGTTWLAENAIWISVVSGSQGDGLERFPEVPASVQRAEAPPIGIALKLTFPGASSDVRIEPLEPLTTTVSYFLGNDPAQWHARVPVYSGVRYADLYPGVDLVLGGRDAFWRLEAEPGAETSPVRMRIEGAGLLASTARPCAWLRPGEPHLNRPATSILAYQANGSRRRAKPWPWTCARPSMRPGSRSRLTTTPRT